MTIWERTRKTFCVYLVQAIFWTVLFFVHFSFRYVFRSLDVFCAFTAELAELPRALACLLVFVKMILSLDSFAGVLLNMHRVSALDDKIREFGPSVTVDGVQRIGKTRSLIYFGMVLQKPKYEDLKYNYYVDCPFEGKLKEEFEKGNHAPYIRFQSRRDAVREYRNPLYIPLVYSNIHITYKGKHERPLKREHFTMEERLFEGNIKLASELDNMLPNTLRKVKKAEDDELKANRIDEFAGLDAQYTGGSLFSDTHRNGALYIPIRDCQDLKIHFSRKKFMYTFKPLKRLLNFVRGIILKREEKTSARLANIAKWLEKQVRSIGFTKLYYLLESGPAGKTQLEKEEKFIVLPNEVPYSYDDRALQKDYYPLGYRKDPEPAPKKEKEEKKKGKKKEEKSAAERPTEKKEVGSSDQK